MKVLIGTVYNSENCGSFYQAYALMARLKELGCEVAFRYRPVGDSSHGKKKLLKGLAAHLRRGDFKGARGVYSQWRAFESAQRLLPVQKSAEASLLVLGSDTIWNILDPYFLKHFHLFDGSGFAGRVASYAASAGNAGEREFRAAGFLENPFSKIDRLSVRDRETARLVRAYTGKDARIVMDPTLLLPADRYPRAGKPPVAGPYLLIYCFGEMPAEIKSAVLDCAKERKLKIVSMGRARDWADLTLPYLPLPFIDCFAGAERVVTNTFHGTIFSLLFHRPFAAFAREKNKVSELLESVGLSERNLAPAEAGRYLSLTDEPIDYEKVEALLEGPRRASLNFLREAVDAAREGTQTS